MLLALLLFLPRNLTADNERTGLVNFNKSNIKHKSIVDKGNGLPVFAPPVYDIRYDTICVDAFPVTIEGMTFNGPGTQNTFKMSSWQNYYYLYLTVYQYAQSAPYISMDNFDCITLVGYLEAGAGSNYQWSTGETTQAITPHNEGLYTVSYIDSHGCAIRDTVYIRHSFNPITSVDLPDTICQGNPEIISVSYQGGTSIVVGNRTASLSVNDTVFLPDGVSCEPYGCSYRSPVTFTEFAPGSTVSSAEDILFVRINMEHSYAKDIYINITCPNGQKADILKYGGTGSSSCNSSIASTSRGWDETGTNAAGNTYFGVPVDDSGNTCNPTPLGTGWNYCWSNNTTENYTYAGGAGSLIYRSVNAHNGRFDSTNVAAMTQVYHPDQSFASLVGCPLNGNWYIEVIDGWSVDNGYIFSWELALQSNLMPQDQPPVTHMIVDGPWAQVINDTISVIDIPFTLESDTDINYTFIVYQEDGCSFDTNKVIHIRVPLVVTYRDTICQGESYSQHGFTVSASETATPGTITRREVRVLTDDYNQLCPDTAILSLVVVSPPQIPPVATPSSICQCESSVLSAEGGTSYEWFNGTSSIGTTPSVTVTPNTTTTYRVHIISKYGCEADFNVNVTVAPVGFSSFPANGHQTVSCADQIHAPNLPTVTDNCNRVLTPTGPVVSNTPACEGNVTYTYTYTDCAGHQRNWVYTYTIDQPDFQIPNTVSTSSTVSCANEMHAPTLPTVTDYCGRTLTPSGPVVSNTPACEGNVTYTYTYTDCAGHHHNWVYTYTIDQPDFQIPNTVSTSSTVSCTNEMHAPTLPTVTDYCGRTLTPSGPVVSNTPACEGNVTYTYTYTDCAGHHHDWVYTYTIDLPDFQIPNTVSTSSTVSCASEIHAPTLPTVTDYCGRSLTPSAPVVSNTPDCEGNVTYTYTYTDCAGHHHDWVYTYTIDQPDFQIPNTVSTSSTVSCASEMHAPTLPTVTDYCGRSLTPSAPVVSNTPDCEGNVTYTYTYTDCAGHQHDWVYTYTIDQPDFQIPNTVSTSSTVSCANEMHAPTLPTVTDYCGRVLTPTGPQVSATPACEGDVTYTYTYTDCAGHHHDWVYTYTIDQPDFQIPNTVSTSSTVSCASEMQAPTLPTVTDYCGRTLTPTGPVVSATPDCEGNVTYTYTYTDCAEHQHDWVYTYTIDQPDFQIPNTVSTSSTVSCASEMQAPTLPTVTDYCGRTLTPTGPVVSATPDCEGNVTYTYTYTDCAEHQHDWVYTYTIDQPDFQIPNTVSTSSTVSCATEMQAPTLPTVTDYCGRTLTPTGPVVSATPDCEGNVTYTYTYTDCAEHQHYWVYTYTIDQPDFQIPNTVSTSSTVSCASEMQAPTLPTVTDYCGRTLTPTGPQVSATPNCEGEVTYTYIYTDCAGHQHDWVYTYTIDLPDFQIPNTVSTSSTVSCTSEMQAPTLPTVTDYCGRALTPTGPQVSATPDCEGNVTYTYTYTDCAGHYHDWVYTYTIDQPDFQIPNTVSTSSTVSCASEMQAPTLPTVTDYCGRTLTPTGPEVSATPDCEGNVTYTYTYTDCAGHYHDWVYTYTIDQPDFQIPNTVSTGSTVSCASEMQAPTLPTVTDYCGRTLTPTGPVVSATPACEGDVTYTYTYRDCAGHQHNWVYTYTIDLPDFQIPNTVSTGSTVSCASEMQAPALPTVTDYCGRTLTPTGPVVSATPSCEGNVTYTYTYTDCAGNSHDWVYTYTIDIPDLTVPSEQTQDVPCEVDAVPPTPPTVYNACGNAAAVSEPVRNSSVGVNGRGDVTYTFTYTDCNGNTAPWTFTYHIQPDAFSPVPDESSEVTCLSTAENQIPEAPSITVCGEPVAVTLSNQQDNTVNGCGTYIYTYSYTVNGNNYQWHYTYNISPADFASLMPNNAGTTISCAADLQEPSLPNVTDYCGRTLTPTGPVVSATPDCEGNVTYTYTYTDCAGNSHDWIYTYTIDIPDFEALMPQDVDTTVNCSADIHEPALPVVTDFCGKVLNPTGPVVSATPDCEGDVTYTYTYTDCAGNSHDWVYTYTIDIPDFEALMPQNIDTTVNCSADIHEPTLPVVKDFCGNVLNPTGSVVSSMPDCEGDVTYTYTYTDCAGNSHDWVYTYTIDIPDFESLMPQNADTTVNCSADIHEPALPVVKDFCGNVLNPTGSVVSSMPDCEGDVTYTYTYTDCAGNSHDWVYTYTIDIPDFEALMPQNDDTTVNCSADIHEPTLPVVNDFCGNVLNPTGPAVSSMPDCEGDVTYTYTYTDCAGNSHDWVYTYTIDIPDFEALMPQNDDTTVNCSADIHEPTLPVVTDFCGNVLNPTGPAVSSMPDCEGDVTYTYTYTDCAGNSHNWVYTYTIDIPDFEALMPQNIDTTVNCSADIHEPNLPVVTDFCGNVLNPTGSVVSATPDCEGDVTYTYTYTDCAGHQHDWVYTYTIDIPDFEALMPQNIDTTVNCSADIHEPTLPVVTDFCGNVLNPTDPVVSSMPDCEGNVTYTYTYTDCAGNSNNWVYTYTIDIPDFEALMPQNDGTSVNCSADIHEPTLPVVTDFCGNVLNPTGPVISPMPDCEGDVTYTYTYTDCADNSHDWVYTYTIDIPDLTAPADQTQDVPCEVDAISPVPPTVPNACGDTTAVSGPVRNSTVGIDGRGDVTYTFTYTDCNNNTADWTFTYHVQPDAYSPVADESTEIACLTEVHEPSLPVVLVCGDTVLMHLTSTSDQTTNGCGDYIYTYTYTVNGTDYNWNYTYIISPEDFTMPDNDGTTINCPDDLHAPSLPSVTDYCGRPLTPTGPDVSDVPDCEGDVTYTYTYTDCAGNSHDWIYTYTIDLPEVNIPTDGAATVHCANQTPEPSTPSVSDACGRNLTAVADAGNPFVDMQANGHGTVTYKYTYTDCTEEVYNWQFVYTVTPEDFTAVADDESTVACATEVATPVLPVITVCDSNIVLYSDSIYSTITDGCGDSVYIYRYTVNDTLYRWTYTWHVQPGDFNMPADLDTTVHCLSQVTHPTASVPTVTDACGRVLTPTVPANYATTSYNGCEGDVTYTYIYEDCNSHQHNWVYTYHIALPDISENMPDDENDNVTCEVDATIPEAPVVLNTCGDTAAVSGPVRHSTVGVDGRGTVTYTYTYTDCNSNTADWTFTYNVIPDAFNPVDNDSLEIHCTAEVQTPTTPIIISCGDTVQINLINIADNTINGCGHISYNYEYIIHNTTYNWHFIYLISPLDFSVADDADTTVICPADVHSPALPLVTDACGRVLLPVDSTITPLPSCEGDITYSYTYKDCAEHSHIWSYTYHIEPLPLIIPDNRGSVIACANRADEPDTDILTDACGRTINAVANAGNPFVDMHANGHGTVTYKYTYTDCTDSVYFWQYVYTIVPDDFTAVADADTTVSCAVEVGTPVLPVIIICDSNIVLSLDSTFNTVTDGCGDAGYIYSYTVNDTLYHWTYTWHVQPVDFAMPADLDTTVYCLSYVTHPTASVPTVTDVCGRVLTPTVPETYAITTYNGCEGDVTYTYGYEDCNGHQHNWVYTYHIILPAISERVPADQSQEITCEIYAYVPEAPVVLNICGDTASVSEVQRISTVAGNGIGNVFYTYTYTDCDGDTASWTFTYIVIPAPFTPTPSDSLNIHCFAEIHQPETPVIISCEEQIDVVLTDSVNNVIDGCGDFTYNYEYSFNEATYHWHYTYLVSPLDFTMPADDDTTVICPADVHSPALPLVTDACGRVLLPIDSTITPLPSCEGDITYSYTYQDCAEHSHIWSYTYHIEPLPLIIPDNRGSVIACANRADEPDTDILTDACGRIINAVANAGNPFVDMNANGHGTVTYKYTYTDCTDSVYFWQYVYTVIPDDFTAVADADTTVSCAVEVGAPVLPVIIICDSSILLTLDSTFNTVTDGCGDAGYIYSYTINDTLYHWTYTWHVQPVDFTMPANLDTTVYCLSQAVLPTLSVPTITDVCGRVLTPTVPETYAITTYNGCEGDVTYTYGYEDCNGHHHNWVYTYHIILPAISERVPADQSQEITCEIYAYVPEAPVVLNICGDTASVSEVQRISTVAGNGIGNVFYTYTYTDCDGDTASWTFTYIVIPAPFTPTPSDSLNIHCFAEIHQPETPVIIICEEQIDVVLTDSVNNVIDGCGDFTYNYEYSFNEATYHWHYTYLVSPLDFVMPADDDTTVICPADVHSPALPLVTDACGRILLPIDSTITPLPSCEGDITYSYTYQDCAEHSHIWSYTYHIEPLPLIIPDNRGSVIACANRADEPYTDILTDACGRTINAVANANNPFVDMHANGHGTVTYKYTYTDCTDSVYFWQYVYTVIPDDFTAVADADTLVSCSVEVGTPVLPVIIICDSNIVLSLENSYSTITDGCGDSVYIYRYTVNDTLYHWTYTWHVQPVDFTMPADRDTTVYCLSHAVLPTASVPTITDFCGRLLTPVVPQNYVITTYNGCEGDVTYTYGYEDCNGHQHNWVYTYHIILPPIAESLPQNEVRYVACENDAIAPAAPVVLNACGNIAQVSEIQHISTVGGNGIGQVIYTYTYTDCNGDTASWNRTYNVSPDPFTPAASDSLEIHCKSEIHQPALPIMVECGSTIDVILTDSVDNVVDGCGDFTYNYRYELYEVVYHWHYTYLVSPLDFTMPADADTTVTCPADVHSPALPLVTDACGRVLLPIDSTITALPDCEGQITYSYTYEDCAEHSHIWSYTYHIDRGFVPVEVAPIAPIETFVECISQVSHPTVLPVIIDACQDTLQLIYTPDTYRNISYEGCQGDVCYTYLYRACSGDTISWTYTYHIADTTRPQYEIPAPMTLCRNIDGSITADPSVTGSPTQVYDNCSGLADIYITHQDHLTQHIDIMDTITRFWSVSDFCGNATIKIQYIYIRPVPVITLIDERSMCDDVISNLYVEETYVSYLWNTGATTRAIAAAVPGTYSVTVMDENYCFARDTITPILYPNPIENIHIPDICQDNSMIITMGYNSNAVVELTNEANQAIVDSMHIYGPNLELISPNTYILSAPDRMIRDTVIDYLFIVYDRNGCTFDSVKSVAFHLNKYTALTDTACDQYVWHNRLYRESGFYIDTLQTIFGCDSVVSLDLTVFYSTFGDTTAYACDVFTWHGITYTESTEEPTFITTNVVGCDSTIRLHLTVYPSYHNHVPVTICEGDGYHDQNFDISQEECIGVDSLLRRRYYESIHGCDSIIELNLSITDTSLQIIPSAESFCEEFELDLFAETTLPNYLWSTGEETASIHVTNLGTYTVIASDGQCSNSAQFTIKPCEFELYLPNTITAQDPDGLNDFFSINERQKKQMKDEEFSIVIYNRTGRLIFESDDKNFQWDGKVKGRVLEGNTYVYVIRCKDLNNHFHLVKGTILTL